MDLLKVSNHIGMNNAEVTGTLGAALSGLNAIQLKGSMYPLIKWDNTNDKVDVYPDFSTSGSYFNTVYY